MAIERINPYGAFNFIVAWGEGNEDQVIGGFAEVSGLGKEVNYSEYRNGNEKYNTVRKIANTFKADDVTLKRGVIGVLNMYKWLTQVANGEDARRQVTITLLDETTKEEVAVWKLRDAQPKKWTGPSLAAKGGGEVAMEELSLVCEDVTFE